MIIATTTFIALRCPECGKFDTHRLSLFDFNNKKTVYLQCTCGAHKVIIGTKNYNSFWLQVPCILCEAKHIFYFKRQELFQDKIAYITCKETNLDLGFVGAEKLIMERAQAYTEDFDNLFEEMDYEEYFNNADVMVEVLNFLHDIAEDGYLFCKCGNFQIDVDIMPDRLELSCSQCDTKIQINAKDKRDFQLIQDIELAKLINKGFTALGDLNRLKIPTNRWKNTKH